MTSTKQKSRVLLLGAGGRLGGMLRRIWAHRPPTGLDLHFQSRTQHAGVNVHQWSPGEPPEKLPACETVIALWGRTSSDARSLALNATLAGHSRAVALACGASRVLHFSSAAVYGSAERATESPTTAPITPYGHSKVDMETRVGAFEDAEIRHTCLRLANVVGADSLAPALAGVAPVTLDRFPDGHGPLRSYIGADDLADILSALSGIPPAALPATLNIAARSPVAMQDLALAAGKDIVWRDAPPSALQRATMDTSQLSKLLPALEPVSDADELIRRWREHHRG